ncbi:hypothetical protein TNCV_1882321 [Trichonephila clavipes]|nr:hypothetical protein TNCV_1882321 [Trichonephila clavipes]
MLLHRSSIFLVLPSHKAAHKVTRETETESMPELDESGNVNEEVVDFATQINLEVYNDDVQELLDTYNQELTIDELTEIHEQKQGIEELEP